jgi:hypothetical protein
MLCSLQVAALLHTTHESRRFSDAVTRELLSSYVDELAAWALGDGPRAAGLLACWGWA